METSPAEPSLSIRQAGLGRRFPISSLPPIWKEQVVRSCYVEFQRLIDAAIPISGLSIPDFVLRFSNIHSGEYGPLTTSETAIQRFLSVPLASVVFKFDRIENLYYPFPLGRGVAPKTQDKELLDCDIWLVCEHSHLLQVRPGRSGAERVYAAPAQDSLFIVAPAWIREDLLLHTD